MNDRDNDNYNDNYSNYNDSKILNSQDDIKGADLDDKIEIDKEEHAKARERRTIIHRKLSKAKQRIEWRRSKVVEMLARGVQLSDIARALAIPYPTLYKDVTYMRDEGKEKIDQYIGHLPFEVRVAVSSLNKILYNLYNIQSLEAAKIEGRHVTDTNRIQALSVMKDVVKMKIDILTNTATLKEALSFIEDKRAEIQKYRSEIDRIAIEDKQAELQVVENINDVIIEQQNSNDDNDKEELPFIDSDNDNHDNQCEEPLEEDKETTTKITKEEG